MTVPRAALWLTWLLCATITHTTAAACDTAIQTAAERDSGAIRVDIIVTSSQDRSAVRLQGSVYMVASDAPLVAASGCSIVELSATPCAPNGTWCLDITMDLAACEPATVHLSWAAATSTATLTGPWTLTDETGQVLADSAPIE